ncbi:MAG: T9SS type A sorting domain-containing protein [candidate division Zixibacteria bacterium]|nr:T9SS type A sorting domain-containing protein [candidate division Zixibacteria bacterium]
MKALNITAWKLCQAAVFTAILLLTTGFANAEVINYRLDFNVDQLIIQQNESFAELHYHDWERLASSGEPELPFTLVKLLIPASEGVDSVVTEGRQEELPGCYKVSYADNPVKTSLLEPLSEVAEINEEIYACSDRYPSEQAIVIDEGYFGSNHIITLQLFPIVYHPAQGLLKYTEKLEINVFTSASSAREYELHNPKPVPTELLSSMVDNYGKATQYANSLPSSMLRDVPSLARLGTEYLQYEYVVITDESLAEAYEDLVEWKKRKGLNAGVVTLQDIESNYTGIDLQEKIRNYLKDAYQYYLKWVLLGGDETIIPIRYAYHVNTSGQPALNSQQICDLYYSDLTGNWDVDGDGVYGEPTSDDPDIYPEVFVGRVTATTPEGVEVYTQKLIQYETDPGNGDLSYLNKALIISADQLVDAGQHVEIGNEMPDNWVVDTTSCVERPDGYNSNPTTPTGQQILALMNEGAGFISNLNHGAPQHYAARAPYYNKFPNKSYMISDVHYEEDHHGVLVDLDESFKYGVHYSISCDIAAYDMDVESVWPGYNWPTDQSFGETFIELANKGGIAFLGNGRWGWVPTSYKLEKAFIQTVFGEEPIGRHLGAAEALGKQVYPYYRDLNYGHFLLGDPEVILWDRIPETMSIVYEDVIEQSPVSYKVHVESNGSPLKDAKVCLYKKEDVLEVAYTDADGDADIHINPLTGGDMYVTVLKDGFLPALAEVEVVPEMGVDEDDVNSPAAFKLKGNYPNPFNGSTVIQFTLDKPSDVKFSVYDISGREVYSENISRMNAGNQAIRWNAVNNHGGAIASGYYLYKIQAGNNSAIGKTVLVK